MENFWKAVLYCLALVEPANKYDGNFYYYIVHPFAITSSKNHDHLISDVYILAANSQISLNIKPF